MTDKKYKIEKFPEELRTFETRLLFIKELLENKFDNIDIMAHCIVHKLDRSYLNYLDDLKKSEIYLTGNDPLDVMKKLK